MEIHKQTHLPSLSALRTHIFPSSVLQSKEVVHVNRVVIEKDLDIKLQKLVIDQMNLNLRFRSPLPLLLYNKENHLYAQIRHTIMG